MNEIWHLLALLRQFWVGLKCNLDHATTTIGIHYILTQILFFSSYHSQHTCTSLCTQIRFSDTDTFCLCNHCPSKWSWSPGRKCHSWSCALAQWHCPRQSSHAAQPRRLVFPSPSMLLTFCLHALLMNNSLCEWKNSKEWRKPAFITHWKYNGVPLGSGQHYFCGVQLFINPNKVWDVPTRLRGTMWRAICPAKL